MNRQSDRERREWMGPLQWEERKLDPEKQKKQGLWKGVKGRALEWRSRNLSAEIPRTALALEPSFYFCLHFGFSHQAWFIFSWIVLKSRFLADIPLFFITLHILTINFHFLRQLGWLSVPCDQDRHMPTWQERAEPREDKDHGTSDPASSSRCGQGLLSRTLWNWFLDLSKIIQWVQKFDRNFHGSLKILLLFHLCDILIPLQSVVFIVNFFVCVCWERAW